MTRRGVWWAAAIALAPVAGPAADSATPFTFRVAALVQAGPARWPELPGAARIGAVPATRFIRPFLEAGPGIPVRAPAVTRALADALAPLAPADRTRVGAVLDAIGAWAMASLTVEPGPVPAASAWRDASRVLADRRGNAFELVRALTALARAAGIPARPTFNGVPVTLVQFTSPEGASRWTAWDPLHPGAAARLLPVAWLPLRGGDLPPVTIEPGRAVAAPLTLDVRRHPDRAAAVRDFEAVRATGGFASAPPPPLRADAADWWEVWTIGAAVDPPAGRWTAVVALPYVRDLDYGTREHGVWVADPARAPVVTGPLSETDPGAGGLVMTLKLAFRAIPR